MEEEANQQLLDGARIVSSSVLEHEKQKEEALAGERKPYQQQPQVKPDKTSTALQVISVLLCIGGTAFLVVVILNSPIKPFTSQIQFVGHIQLQERKGKLITWEDGYSSVTTQAFQQLATEVSSKLRIVLEAEGFVVDEVSITKMEKEPPVTFTRDEVVSPLGRVADRGGRKVNSTSQEGISPRKMLMEASPRRTLLPYRTKSVTYKDISYVNVKFETRARPSENAIVFKSAKQEQWQRVGTMVQLRLASDGLKTLITNFSPSNAFISEVQRYADQFPHKLVVPSQSKDRAQPTGCTETGSTLGRNRNPSRTFKCPPQCSQIRTILYGGKDNIFGCETPVCAAAIYSGVIQVEGEIRVWYAGASSVEAGPNTTLHETKNRSDYDCSMVPTKNSPVIRPTPLPSPVKPGEVRFASGGDADVLSIPIELFAASPVVSDETPFTGAEPLVIHTIHEQIAAENVTYEIEDSDIRNSKIKRFMKTVKPQLEEKLREFGLVFDHVELRAAFKPGTGVGIGFGFAVLGSDRSVAESFDKLWTGDRDHLEREKEVFEGFAKVINWRLGRNVLLLLKKLNPKTLSLSSELA